MSVEKKSGAPVVVTGAAGFIGARLASHLTGEGERVIAVDEKSHFESRPEIISIYQNAPPEEIVGLDDLPEWLDETSAGGISGIIHILC